MIVEIQNLLAFAFLFSSCSLLNSAANGNSSGMKPSCFLLVLPLQQAVPLCKSLGYAVSCVFVLLLLLGYTVSVFN